MADDTEEKTESAAPSCTADSNFAVICSFLEKFSPAIGLPNLPFTQLQEMLEDQDQVSQVLVDLHVKLLRKARRSSFTLDKWEKALTKFAHTYSQQDGWELERFSYKKASLGVKIRLLKMLLEAQFDQNVKFKNEINKLNPSELRVEPLGCDSNGLRYWCQFDPACNVRVYQEDVEDETWDLIAQDRHGLVNLINNLSSGEGQQELDLILKEEASQEASKPPAENGQEKNCKMQEGESAEEEDGESNEEDEGEKSNEDDEEDDEEEEESEEDESETGNEAAGSENKPDVAVPEPVSAPPVPEPLSAPPVPVPVSKSVPKTGSSPTPLLASGGVSEKQEQPEMKPELKSIVQNGDVVKADSPEVLEPPAPAQLATTVPNAVKTEGPALVKMEEDIDQNASVDLTMAKPQSAPKPPPIARPPGSKLEQIFKTKIYPFNNPGPYDKSSILSQMAVRFNSAEDSVVEDLSSSSKKPKLDYKEMKPNSVKVGNPEPLELGDPIEEKVKVVHGEGAGAECDAGNPLASDHDVDMPDAPLQVVGMFSASSEECARNALKQCILEDLDLSKTSDYPDGKSGYTSEEYEVLERIRRLNTGASTGSKKFEVGSARHSPDFVFEASEVIEEDVMYFSGCGAGHDNDTGNLTEASKDESSTSKQEEVEKKVVKKLWTIDTICKSNSVAEDEPSSASVASDSVASTEKAVNNVETKLPDDGVSNKSPSDPVDLKKLPEAPNVAAGSSLGLNPSTTEDDVLPDSCSKSVANEELPDENDSNVPKNEKQPPLFASSSNNSLSPTDNGVGEVEKDVVELPGSECSLKKPDCPSEKTLESRETNDSEKKTIDVLGEAKESIQEPPKEKEIVPAESETFVEKDCLDESPASPDAVDRGETAKPDDQTVEAGGKNKPDEQTKTEGCAELKENKELDETRNKIDENDVNSTVSASELSVEKAGKEFLTGDLDKSEGKACEKRVDSSEKETVDRPGEKPVENAKENVENKQEIVENTQEIVENAQEIVENAREKSVDSPQGKTVDSAQEETNASSREQNVDSSQEKTVENILEKTLDSPREKAVNSSQEKIVENAQNKTEDSFLEKTVEVPQEKDAVPTSGTSIDEKPKSDADGEKNAETAEEKVSSDKCSTDKDDELADKPKGRKSRSNTTSTEGDDETSEIGSKPRSTRRSSRSAALKISSAVAPAVKRTRKGPKTPAAKAAEAPSNDGDSKAAVEPTTEAEPVPNVKISLANDGKSDDDEGKLMIDEDSSSDAKKSIDGNATPADPPAKVEKPKRGKRSAKKTTILGLTETDLQGVEIDDTPGGGRMRASRRIAMQKIKEDANRRSVYEDASRAEAKSKKKSKNEAKNDKNSQGHKSSKIHKGSANKTDKFDKKKKRNKKPETEEEEEADDQQADEGKKRKRKDKFKYNIDRPWASSSDDDDENIEDEEEDHLEYMDEDDIVVGKAISDHEFSCDEDLETREGDEAVVVPVRRARTAVRPKDKPSVEEDEDEVKDEVEDYKCEKCGKDDNPDWILLCDSCDKGYHAACLRPPLMLIPEGDWYCPVCQHSDLVKKLKDVLRTFEKNSKKRDNEELRRKRLAYVGISLANVLPESAGNKVKKSDRKKDQRESEKGGDDSSNSSESSSSAGSSSESSEDEDDEPVYQLRQRRAAVNNYRFNDYDQLIDSAIQDEMGTEVQDPSVVQPVENGEVAKIETEVEQKLSEDAEGKTNDDDASKGKETIEEEEEEEGDVKKGWRPPVISRSSSQPFSGRKRPKKLCNLDVVSDENDSDEDFKGSSSDEEDEDFSEGSDDSGVGRKSRQPLRRSGRARRSRVDKDFINDDSEDEYNPRAKKQKKKRDWSESSESSSDRSWGRRKKKPANRSFSKATSRSGKKRRQRFTDSDSDVPKKKSKGKKPKIRYGLSADEDDLPTTRTRGRKMNYTEIHGSDTEEEERINRIKGRKTLSDMEAEDEEFVLDKEEEEEFMGGVSFVRKAPQRIVSSNDEEDEGEVKSGVKSAKPQLKATASEVRRAETKPPAVKPTGKSDDPTVKPPPPARKTVPPISQRLPPTKPQLAAVAGKFPAQKVKADQMESDEDDGDFDEGEEESVLDEEEEEDESEEEKMPRRQIPPPVPSLNIRVPGRPPPIPLKVTSIQSKLKEALNNPEPVAPRRPLESEALLRLREKLANAANRPGQVSVTGAAPANPPADKSGPAASAPRPFPSPKPAAGPKTSPGPKSAPAGPHPPKSPSSSQHSSGATTPESSPEKEPPKDKPLVNSIRVVSTQKLLANPNQQETLLKRPLMAPMVPPEQAMLMRGGGGMLIVPGFAGGGRPPMGHHGHHPPPLGLYYGGGRGPSAGMGPVAAAPAGIDPAATGRFLPRPPPPSQASPAHHQHHPHQQRRFPDRAVYGPVPPGGFHAGGGGFYPSAPGATPFAIGSPGPPPPPKAEALQQLPPSEFPTRSPPPPSDVPRVGGGGEFGGLVSYFSSQAQDEDDELET